MRVDDYTEDEMQEDIELVNWDFAYNEILKLEEHKKSLYTREANQRMQEERQRLEEQFRLKHEEEQLVLQQKMEELRKNMEENELQRQNDAQAEVLTEEAIREKEAFQQEMLQLKEKNEMLQREYERSMLEKEKVEAKAKKEKEDSER